MYIHLCVYIRADMKSALSADLLSGSPGFAVFNC